LDQLGIAVLNHLFPIFMGGCTVGPAINIDGPVIVDNYRSSTPT
jgi:hypothetical protein